MSRPKGIDNQTVVRLNRYTLYSSAVLDLDGYARGGRWELLFNALVLAASLEGTTSR